MSANATTSQEDGGVMMIKASSLFGQILSEIFSAVDFGKLVVKHKAERRAKGFRSRTQLISMLFRHLARADSFREIVNGLSCCNGKLVHLGIGTPPKRSTLAYANERRPAALFEDLFNELLARFRFRAILDSGEPNVNMLTR